MITTYLQSRCKSTVYFLEHIHSLICISLSELTNCLLFETLVRLSSKHESCFRFAYWKMVIFTKLLNSITWEHLCVFQCTPPQQPTLMSPLMPAIMTKRGIHTWETGTAWSGWRTLMRWVSPIGIIYSMLLYKVLNLVKIEIENLFVVCNILFTSVLYSISITASQ